MRRVTNNFPFDQRRGILKCTLRQADHFRIYSNSTGARERYDKQDT